MIDDWYGLCPCFVPAPNHRQASQPAPPSQLANALSSRAGRGPPPPRVITCSRENAPCWFAGVCSGVHYPHTVALGDRFIITCMHSDLNFLIVFMNLAASDSLPFMSSIKLWFLKYRRDGLNAENKPKALVIVSNERGSCVEVCCGILVSCGQTSAACQGFHRAGHINLLLQSRATGRETTSRPCNFVRLLLIDRQGQQRAQSFSHQTVSPWGPKVESTLQQGKKRVWSVDAARGRPAVPDLNPCWKNQTPDTGDDGTPINQHRSYVISQVQHLFSRSSPRIIRVFKGEKREMQIDVWIIEHHSLCCSAKSMNMLGKMLTYIQFGF